MMTSKLQQTTKYAGVYKDLSSGKFFYQTEFGVDRISGKRVRRKKRKDTNGRPFTTASSANKELTRVKREYQKTNGYGNYRMTYNEFMSQVFIPAYKTDVEESTFSTRKHSFELLQNRFGKKMLRAINIEDVQNFRTYLLTPSNEGGTGFSQAYAALVFGTFRQTLDMAVKLRYLDNNIAKRFKAIPKGKAIVPFWDKHEFEKVISQICIDNFFEHLYFAILWVGYMTGLRVNELFGLFWEDVDLDKKVMRVHHMLVLKSRHDWKRNNYTKTESGKRTISLDDDTVSVLRKWKQRQKTVGLGGESDFVFTYDSLPMLKSTLANVIKRYSKAAHVKVIQAKGLRHSHASYLINEFNVSVLALSKRLGHSDPSITLSTYSHLFLGADHAIAEKMSGNIKIHTAKKTKVHMEGNMPVIKLKDAKCPPSTPPENVI